MKRLIIALVLVLALAAPALAAEDVFLYGSLVDSLQEDGTTRQELQLADGTTLPKVQQHQASMVNIGEVPGKGKVWWWLDTEARAKELRDKHAAAYIGAKLTDIPAGDSDYVLEVEVATTDKDGKGTVVRMKVAEAKAKGVDVAKLAKKPPHKWSGRE